MKRRGEIRWLSGAASLACALTCVSLVFAIGLEKKPKPPGDATAESEAAPQTGGSRATESVRRPAAGSARPEARERRPTPADRIAAEERKHLRRMAQINRIQAVGIESENQRLVDLARELRDKETERYELAVERVRREAGERARGER